jgi:hypothetical protein
MYKIDPTPDPTPKFFPKTGFKVSFFGEYTLLDFFFVSAKVSRLCSWFLSSALSFSISSVPNFKPIFFFYCFLLFLSLIGEAKGGNLEVLSNSFDLLLGGSSLLFLRENFLIQRIFRKWEKEK